LGGAEAIAVVVATRGDGERHHGGHGDSSITKQSSGALGQQAPISRDFPAARKAKKL
jgi:hypothetical protein